MSKHAAATNASAPLSVEAADAEANDPSVSAREAIADFLRNWRTSRGISQAELARQLHCSRALVNLLEKAKRTPNRQLAESIVRLLNPLPFEARRFLEAAGFAPPPLTRHVATLLPAITLDDPDNLPVGELARLDLSNAALAWQRLIQTFAQSRIGDLNECRSAFEAIRSNHTLSPLIRLAATLGLARVLRMTRELDVAGKLIEDALISPAMRSILTGAPHHGELLRALLTDERGEVALRRGYYQEAHERFESSRADYVGLQSALSNEVPTATAEAIGEVGLALSALRLASALMFLERDSEARDYCTEAEVRLLALPTSAEQLDALRRLVDLRGWACARAQQYDQAIMHHRDALDKSVDARDHIDEIKNWVYIGDDWLHKVEVAIEGVYFEMRRPNGLPITASSGKIWGQMARMEDERAQWLDEAHVAFQKAMALQRKAAHAQSFGHILRGLATVMRLREHFFEASAMLIQAEQHERSHRLDNRIPFIFEVRADLYWDQDMPDLAERWYRSALSALRVVQVAWRERQLGESGVLARHYARIERKLRRLELALASVDRGSREPEMRTEPLSSSTSPSMYQFEASPRQTHDLWHELRSLVVDAVARAQRIPIALSDLDAVWLQELFDFERLPGTRILAQNDLSLSLAATLPSRLRDSGQDVLSSQIVSLLNQRRDAFLSSVNAAQEMSEGGVIVRDLCCRVTIEANTEQDDVQDRAREARRLIEDYPAGYALATTNLAIPFGFAVKRSRTLLEIPARFARTAKLVTEAADMLSGRPAVTVYCYRFDDATLADRLRDLFTVLFDLMNRTSEEETVSVKEWLRDLMDHRSNSPRTLGI